MKKRFLVLMMTGVMAASALTACGDKTTAATTAAETTVATETTIVAETIVAAETTVAEETTTGAGESVADAAGADFNETYETYISWTGKEWSEANEDEKLNAAIAYSIYATEAVSGQVFDASMRTMMADEMKKTEDVKNVVTQLDTTFATLDVSLKEFADAAAEQIAAMAATTAAQ